MALPVCDHYSGVEARMVKSLQLQADMIEEFGTCVFDVTLDCEDGAPVGGEGDQANLVAALAKSAVCATQFVASVGRPRVGVRVHAVGHAAFDADIETIVGQAAPSISYVMVPKVESVSDVRLALRAVDRAAESHALPQPLPLHVLLESPTAIHHAFEIAAHPRVQSVSFGLMDFVSSHGGAVPSSAMGVRSAADSTTLDQFNHPLVVRAKVDIASACHAHGKVPSHCVVTEFRDTVLLAHAAHAASRAFGFTRMWSIHPDQIRPILQAFAPATKEVEQAAEVISLACKQGWAPISFQGKLHDRASYRYFWQILERAHQTGCSVPESVEDFFMAAAQ